MKTLKIKTLENQIKDGITYCITDIKIGYVEICKNNKRQIVNVIK